jgi:hypothetical protein
LQSVLQRRFGTSTNSCVEAAPRYVLHRNTKSNTRLKTYRSKIDSTALIALARDDEVILNGQPSSHNYGPRVEERQ